MLSEYAMKCEDLKKNLLCFQYLHKTAEAAAATKAEESYELLLASAADWFIGLKSFSP